MSKLNELFRNAYLMDVNPESDKKELIKYIRTTTIKLEDISELFRMYGRGINAVVVIELMKHQKVDNIFIEEFKDLLNWNIVFEYQDLEFSLYEKNMEILEKYDIENLIKDDKIKTTKKEKDKFISYFDMKR